MKVEDLTQEQQELLTQGFQKFRQDIVDEIARTKTPDEAAQVGYNLGYGRGFMDGLNAGYAEGQRDEKERDV